MYDLTTFYEVDGKLINLRKKGDFRVILDCISAITDPKLTEEEKAIAGMLIFYDVNSIEDLAGYDLQVLSKNMCDFISCNEENKNAKNRKLIDWEQDENLIMSGINAVVGQEVRAMEYLHWFTFISYYTAISDHSSLATVVSIRDKIMRGKKLEKWEREYKLENPQQFVWKKDLEKIEEENELLNSIWNTKR